jgi:purine-binding chemotaxis protein CheW
MSRLSIIAKSESVKDDVFVLFEQEGFMNAPTVAHANQALNECTQSRAGKYLTFGLAAEEYGIPILKVREIIGLLPITKMPEAPAYMRGIINLRGKVIPVVELRSRFGMETVADSEETCIIVVDLSAGDRNQLMGVLVDAVSEVLEIKADEIQDSPSLGGSHTCDFVMGIGKVKGGVKILLDIERMLSGSALPPLTAEIEAGVSNLDMTM